MKELLSVLQKAGEIMDMHDSTVYWFRGHSDCNYQLIPSVFRPLEHGRFYNESKLLKEFIRIHPEAREKHSNTLELLTYAQHYGLPTRLLDWTTNLLVAIYFACESNFDKDAILYLYNITDELDSTALKEATYHEFVHIDNKGEFFRFMFNELEVLGKKSKTAFFASDLPLSDFINLTDFDNLQSLFSVEIRTDHILSQCWPWDDIFRVSIPYKPMLVNERVKRQHGCFTIHGGKIIDGEDLMVTLAMDEDYFNMACMNHKRVQAIIITADLKTTLLKQLSILGINKAYLFPELEHQTQAIKDHCMY